MYLTKSHKMEMLNSEKIRTFFINIVLIVLTVFIGFPLSVIFAIIFDVFFFLKVTQNKKLPKQLGSFCIE